MKWSMALALMAAIGPVHAGNGAAPPLFTAILDASSNPPPRTLASYPVTVNFPALDANPATIEVQLPGSGTYIATRQRFTAAPDGGYHWYGRTSLHDVLLTVNGDLITGFIRGGDDTYSVLSSVSGGSTDQTLQEMNAAAFPGDVAEMEVSGSSKAFLTIKGATNAEPHRRCFGRPEQPIDVLIVYSPQALAASGGDVTALENQLSNAVFGATVTLANSQVPVEARLVAVEAAPATLNEAGTTLDYTNAVNNADLAARRRFWAADVVTYLTSVGMNGANTYCGVTSRMRLGNALGYGYDYAPNAVNVVTWQCGVQNNDLSHEMGHNSGLDHNPESTSGTPAINLYPFAFGHSVNGQFRDDMGQSNATLCPQGCPRQMFFSDPSQTFNSVARGVAGARDNAQTYRRMFRCVNTFAEYVFGDGLE